MDEVGRNKLWQEYMQTGKSEIREQLIAEYAQLVKLVAGRLSMYLGYNVEYDDLVGYGIFGLIDAIDKFDYSKNVKFESYASLRIRGAILDQIRKMDWLPRSIRQKQKKIDAAMSKIETEKGHVATTHHYYIIFLVITLFVHQAVSFFHILWRCYPIEYRLSRNEKYYTSLKVHLLNRFFQNHCNQ
jgi:RNA polymerase sigma factor (sigma-70 family)